MTGSQAYAQIGFQATLADSTSLVSRFEPPDYSFSAAMQPQSYPPISRRLIFEPRVIRGSFADNTITFNTQITNDLDLVPVTVGATEYYHYRARKMERDKFQESFSKSLSAAQRGDRREGLNIGFSQLPRRFDKIFGEGGANLKITGYRRITFSGRSTWTDGAESDLFRQSKFPSLNMEQISRFDITGTIGSKITVSVSQDNQTDIPLSNRLQIRYKGDDDDILKSIEAGNTNLSLPNTRFVGYSSRIQGLFGIKAEAQVGNLTLTAIASQEKGSSEKASVDAAGEANAEYIRDYQYETNRIFDVAYSGELGRFDKVTKLYVYEEEKSATEADFRYGQLMIDPRDPNFESNYTEIQKMYQVEEDQYIWVDDQERNLHYVVFNNRRYDNRAIAIYFEVEHRSSAGGPVESTTQYGSITSDTLQLRVLRGGSDGQYGPSHPAWDLMWRNAYDIPKGVSVDDIDIKVFKGTAGQEGQSTSFEYQKDDAEASEGYYLEILGLDQFTRTGQNRPDNKVDERQEVFRSDWGLLIFPSRTPFFSDTTFDNLAGSTAPLRETDSSLYYYTSSSQQTKASKYYIQYVSKSRSSIIRLNRVNIIEGSDVVKVNGRQLQRGVDYNIDYSFGSITLIDEEAIDPNAQVSIDYEYAPFLTLQKKTLFGVRAEYEWSKDLRFGTTWLYKSDKAQDRKPRVGQETAKMMVLDFDMDFKIYPGFMTKAVDALPGIQTDQQSVMSVSAEIAQSYPNPNVDDEAYVDDFESALDQLGLGMSRTNWSKASRPLQLVGDWQRGKMLWHLPYYLPLREDVYVGEVRQGEGEVKTLRLIYRPNNLEITNNYQFDTTVVDSETVIVDTTFLGSDTSLVRSWAGIVRAYDSRVDAERAQLFEMRARGTGGRIHIDMGFINEDVNGDGKAFGEDDVSSGGDQSGTVSDEEDVGLDGLADQQEPGYSADTLVDPNGDNWYFRNEGKCPFPSNICNSADFQARMEDPNDPLYYEFLNGTEGNRRDATTQGLPDEEKLTGSFSQTNSYFSFVIDLDNYADSFKVEGSERNGWATYRIPIRDSLALDTIVDEGGNPTWDKIQHIRVWFESDEIDTEEDTLEIADWYFVQSNWQDTLIHRAGAPVDDDVRFVVASVSTDDGTFTPPPNVEAYEDPTDGVEEAQRGLALSYENLRPGDTAIASRVLIQSEAYSGYEEMKMYVWGDSLTNIDYDSVSFFIRLGTDSVNFYEWHTTAPLYPRWDERNFVNINFQDITGLKDEALRNLESGEKVDITRDEYRVKGTPNINQVKYFALGVTNTSQDSLSAVTGDVWVDELRVTSVRRDVGTAARVSVAGNAADLFTYSFSYLTKDPYFRGISAATRGGSSNNLGSGQTENNIVWSSTLNLDKFFPRSWGARLPVSFSYNKTTLTPLLRNNSDIVLPEELRVEERSTSDSRSFRISEQFNKKSRNPLFTVLLNRQSLSFSYQRSRQASVNRPFYLGENINVQGSYNAGITEMPTIPIFFWTKYIPIAKKASNSRLGIYPSTWRWNGSLSRNLSISEDSDFRRVSSLSKTFDGSMDLTYQVFENLRTTLRYNTKRDLADPDLINITTNPKDFKLGLETNYSQSFSADYDPKLIGFLSNKWNYTSSYRDSWERSNESRKADMSRNWSVGGQFKHLELFSIGSGGGGSSRPRGRTSSSVDRPFYDPPLAVLRFLTGWIEPISYKYGQSYNNSLPGLLNRPSLGFRFGIDETTDVDRITETRTPFSSEGENYDLSSGFKLFGGIDTDVRYAVGVTRDLVKTGTRYENRSIKWPDLQVRISTFSSFPLIKGLINKFITVFQPRTGFSRDTKETQDLDGDFLLDKSVTTSFSPLLSVNFRLFRTLSLSGSYTVTEVESERYNRQNGELDNESTSDRSSIAFSSRYSFSAPGGIAIPLFGKMKFNSTVSIDLNVRFNKELTKNSQDGRPFVITADKSDLTIAPNISYAFSQQIKGGVSAKWQDTNDSKLSKKSHVRELQIWAEIRF